MKLRTFVLVAISACLLIAGLRIAKPQISAVLRSFKDTREVQKVKEHLLAKYPRLAELKPRQLVSALRDIAYAKVKVGVKGGNLSDPWKAFDESVVSQSAEHSCQGINIVYRVMLTAFDISSREVDFYGDNEVDPGEVLYSHATTGVFLDGKWEATDATFNLVVKDAEGNALSWVDAFNLKEKGQPINFMMGSDVVIRRRTNEEAQDGIGKAMKYMFIVGDEVKAYPPSWDGKIDFVGDRVVDFHTESQPIYHRLAELVD